MPHARVNGLNLHYYDEGEGEALLFIPGLIGLGSTWEFQFRHFSGRFRCLSFDHRGAGGSDRPREGYSTAQIAADAVALLDALGVERARVAGASTGGCILQNLCLDHPQRVERAIFTNTWTRADPYFTRLQTARKQILAAYGKDAYVEVSSLWTGGSTMFRHKYETMLDLEKRQKETAAEPEILQARIDMTLAHDRSAEIGRIRAPSLLIAARDDILTPPYFLEDMSRMIQGSRLVILDEGGHNAYRRNPAAWNRAAGEFLGAA